MDGAQAAYQSVSNQNPIQFSHLFVFPQDSLNYTSLKFCIQEGQYTHLELNFIGILHEKLNSRVSKPPCASQNVQALNFYESSQELIARI